MSCRPMASVTENDAPQRPDPSASANATPIASASGMCCTVSAKKRSHALRVSAAVGPSMTSLAAAPRPPAAPLAALRPLLSRSVLPLVWMVNSTPSVPSNAPWSESAGSSRYGVSTAPATGAGGGCVATGALGAGAGSSAPANTWSRPTNTTHAATTPTATGTHAYTPSASSDTAKHSCSKSITADNMTAQRGVESLRTYSRPATHRTVHTTRRPRRTPHSCCHDSGGLVCVAVRVEHVNSKCCSTPPHTVRPEPDPQHAPAATQKSPPNAVKQYVNKHASKASPTALKLIAASPR